MYLELKNMQTPEDMNAYYKCMKLEWILLTVLSVQMLHKLFVRKKAPCFKFNKGPKAAEYAVA